MVDMISMLGAFVQLPCAKDLTECISRVILILTISILGV